MLSWFQKIVDRARLMVGHEQRLEAKPETLPRGRSSIETRKATEPRLEPEGFEQVWNLLMAPSGPILESTSGPEEEVIQDLVELLLAHFHANLPVPTSFPALAVQVVDLLEQEDPEMSELVKVIGQDPAISVHVMRVANSSLYQRDSDAQDLRSAVLRIGTRNVAEIAMGVAGRSLFDVSLRAEYELFEARWRELFLSTMTIAFCASQFAYEEHVGRADRAFLLGMFHDLGTSLALRSLAALQMSGQLPPGIPPGIVDKVLDRVHLEVGSTVHRIWSLPHHLTDWCSRHHDPTIPAQEENAELHVLRIVSGFNRLCLDPTDTRHIGETRQSMEALRIDRKHATRFFSAVGRQRERVHVLFPD
jgi:HD-like signal output (HDOD) protein